MLLNLILIEDCTYWDENQVDWHAVRDWSSVDWSNQFCISQMGSSGIQCDDVSTIDCIYPWTLTLKTCFTWHQTSMFQVSNFEVSPPKLKLTWPWTSMFQVSNFEVSPPKCSPQCFFASYISDFCRFSSDFLESMSCCSQIWQTPGKKRVICTQSNNGLKSARKWQFFHGRFSDFQKRRGCVWQMISWDRVPKMIGGSSKSLGLSS